MIDYWFMTQEPNCVEDNWIYLTVEKPSKEEIKNKVVIVNNEKYDLINIVEIKEYLVKHPNCNFYDSLLEEIPKDMKKYLLKQDIRIKKSINF
jgi:hypothetical protein